MREGQSIFSYSLKGCFISNFVPVVTAGYLLIQSDGAVGYDDPSILDNTSTGPNNLFFFGASTTCYKTVANITYLLPNCSHELLNETCVNCICSCTLELKMIRVFIIEHSFLLSMYAGSSSFPPFSVVSPFSSMMTLGLFIPPALVFVHLSVNCTLPGPVSRPPGHWLLGLDDRLVRRPVPAAWSSVPPLGRSLILLYNLPMSCLITSQPLYLWMYFMRLTLYLLSSCS